ncbi:MAG: phasin family protein, partial [Sphingomonadales bacterium]
KQMQDMLSEFKGGFADLPLANEEMGKVIAATRDATVTGMEDMNKEISSFTQSRMTEYWETTRGVLGARSLPEAFEVQNKYMQDTYKAYADEAQKLNTIATAVTQKAFSPMSEGMFGMFTKMFNSRAA